MPKKNRANAYFRERLKRDYPTIFDDLEAGRIPNVRQAAIKAGLIRPSTRIGALKREWSKASAADRKAFVDWVKMTAPTRPASAAAPAPSAPIVNPDRQLTVDGRTRITAVMTDRKLKLGDVMREIGLKPLNASLGNALRGPSRIRPDLAAALELWLDKHEKR